MKRVLLTALLACVCGAAAAAAAVYLWPFQVDLTLRRWALRHAGVERVRVGTLAGYERDLCRPGQPCSCVALIHGLGDSAMTWDKLLGGQEGAAPPPQGTRLLALELPGSEGSAPPGTPAGYAVPAMAQTVADSLRERCPSWTLVGNSLGGWVSLWTALKWPQGVRRLLLLNSVGVDGSREEQVAVARLLENPTVAGLKDFSARAYHIMPPAPERAWPAVVASIAARPTRAMVAALRPEDLLDARARQIRIPTLVLWGLSDRAIPRSVGEKLAASIPGALFQGIPDCGHLPQRECPAVVTDALYR